MSTIASEISIKDIVFALQARKYNNERTVLFLGSRTSALLYNQILYEMLSKFSKRIFDRLPEMEKFRECYHILNDQERFTEMDIHEVLAAALRGLEKREEDSCLAELINEEFFDGVISTCLDDLLEKGCLHAKMTEGKEFQVFHTGFDSCAVIISREADRPTIIRIFGDLEQRRYTTVGNEFDLEADPELKSYLESKMAKNILVVGYDPVWDGPIEDIFPEQGGDFYYVNEQPLPVGSSLARAFYARGGKYCIGSSGSYRTFIKQVHWLVHHVMHLPPPPVPGREKTARKKVFVSYSHRDKSYLDRLLVYLKPYEQDELLEVWSDEDIEVGADWREKIQEALDAAKVAVLLISQDFLVSKFITEVELPQLLAKAESGGGVIIPINLVPSTIKDMEQLYRFQAVNDPKRPLSKMRKHQRDEVWVKVADRVKKACAVH